MRLAALLLALAMPAGAAPIEVGFANYQGSMSHTFEISDLASDGFTLRVAGVLEVLWVDDGSGVHRDDWGGIDQGFLDFGFAGAPTLAGYSVVSAQVDDPNGFLRIFENAGRLNVNWGTNDSPTAALPAAGRLITLSTEVRVSMAVDAGTLLSVFTEFGAFYCNETGDPQDPVICDGTGYIGPDATFTVGSIVPEPAPSSLIVGAMMAVVVSRRFAVGRLTPQ